MIKVYNARDIMEAQEIVEFLKENGIPASHHDAAGNVVGYTVTGFGLYGVDIYVDEADRETAAKLIEEMENAFRD